MSGRGVVVALDRERHLRFTINALVDLEQVLGMSLGDLFAQPAGVGITTLRAALWAGLKHEDPKLSLAHTGDLVQDYIEAGGSFPALGTAIKQALELAGFGDKSDTTAPNENGAAAGPFPSGVGSTASSP